MSTILPPANPQDIQQEWNKYYRLRQRARLGLLAFLIAAYLLPIPVGIATRNLHPNIQITVFAFVILIAAGVCAKPLFKWAAWKCPRCSKKFAEPQRRFGWLYSLVLVLWRLAFDSRCATC